MRTISRSLYQALMTTVFLVVTSCASQQVQEVYAPAGRAINGYDPVAFFTNNKPTLGTEEFKYNWKGANWYFASKENLQQFAASPERYAPQYGGYCAYGTAEGHKAPTKAETFTIEDGKLYFNYNNDVKKEWDKNRPAFISKADLAWPEVKKQKE